MSVSSFLFYFSINQFWLLVDGIYPDLAQFVKNMSEPLTDPHKNMQNGRSVQGKILSMHLVS
jgi:hypothetical protein